MGFKVPPTQNILGFHVQSLEGGSDPSPPGAGPTPLLCSAPDLMPENVVEEKIKELDLNMVMAEIRREGRPGAQWR